MRNEGKSDIPLMTWQPASDLRIGTKLNKIRQTRTKTKKSRLLLQTSDNTCNDGHSSSNIQGSRGDDIIDYSLSISYNGKCSCYWCCLDGFVSSLYNVLHNQILKIQEHAIQSWNTNKKQRCTDITINITDFV
jgi:hypothetical protein